MKRWLALILALIMLFFVSACGADKEDSEASEPADESITDVSSDPEEEAGAEEESKEKTEAEKEEENLEIGATAEDREFVFGDIVLSLTGHFENNIGPESGYAQYTDPYYGFLDANVNANPAPGQDQSSGDELFGEFENEEIGVVSVYSTGDGYRAEFAVGPDNYTLAFEVFTDKGLDINNATDWFINMIMRISLSDEGKMKAQAAEGGNSPEASGSQAGDSVKLQAFYMSTFEALTGTAPDAFTASDPQPYTVYLIVAGDGFTIDHRLVGFDEMPEEEYSEQFSQSMGMLEEKLANEGHTLIYASDPGRAKMIIIKERTYKPSSKVYPGLTAYDCAYKEILINTATHETKTFEAYNEPDNVLRDIPMTMKNYYCGTTYDTYEYKDFLDSVGGWLE